MFTKFCRFLLLPCIILFLILAIKVDGRMPYYEMRGFVAFEFMGLGISYSWPDKGFDRTYCSQLVLHSPVGYVALPENYYRGIRVDANGNPID